MKATRIGPTLYRDDKGRLWDRPTIKGKRTWRRLWSLTITEAKKELAVRRSDHHRAAIGLTRDPYAASPTLGHVLTAYSRAGYPNARGIATVNRSAQDAARRMPLLMEYFEKTRVHDLTLSRLIAYGSRRPSRAAELELYTLRNALRHALRHGRIDRDPISHWPSFHHTAQTRHCRDAAPLSGDELHDIARHLLAHHQTEPLAWWLLLLALTGCRRSEILDLRLDAGPKEPGHVQGQWLWLRRRKGGTNPFAVIHPALADCLAAHRRWHDERFAKNHFYIPHRIARDQHADRDGLGHALRRYTAERKLPSRTPHGLRAFFVTVRRSAGISDAQIAAEIGDATGAAIVAQVYGAVPPNWQGGPELSFLPTAGPPAWAPWGPQSVPQSAVPADAAPSADATQTDARASA